MGFSSRAGKSLVAPVVAACLWGCTGEPSPGPALEGVERPDVVLILVDTLRADHLGLYGYSRPTSPRLDRLGSSSTLYMRAYSQAPWTTPSVAALMTGRAPSRLGIADLPDALPEELDLLAERLGGAGYVTAAAVSHDFLGSGWNFDQGFDTFDEKWAVGHAGVSSPGVTEAAMAAVDAAGDRPLFLFAHYFDPHAHYLRHDDADFTGEVAGYDGPLRARVTPRKLKEMAGARTDADVDWARALYDSEIAFTDRHIGRLLEHLQARGRLDGSLVIVTADHGEEFGDHGDFGHTNTLYEELVRVPLLIKMPGQTTSRRVEVPVTHVDLLPTILDIAGLPPAPDADGLSLRDDPPADRPVFCATARGRNLRAVIRGSSKLIRDLDTGSLQLFDLETDPAERRDRAGAAEVVAVETALAALLAGWIAEAVPEIDAAGPVELDEATRERLRSLGYLD